MDIATDNYDKVYSTFILLWSNYWRVWQLVEQCESKYILRQENEQAVFYSVIFLLVRRQKQSLLTTKPPLQQQQGKQALSAGRSIMDCEGKAVEGDDPKWTDEVNCTILYGSLGSWFVLQALLALVALQKEAREVCFPAHANTSTGRNRNYTAASCFLLLPQQRRVACKGVQRAIYRS